MSRDVYAWGRVSTMNECREKHVALSVVLTTVIMLLRPSYVPLTSFLCPLTALYWVCPGTTVNVLQGFVRTMPWGSS